MAKEEEKLEEKKSTNAKKVATKKKTTTATKSKTTKTSTTKKVATKENTEVVEAPKRGRGRPKKVETTEVAVKEEIIKEEPKRGRGRPKKVQTEETVLKVETKPKSTTKKETTTKKATTPKKETTKTTSKKQAPKNVAKKTTTTKQQKVEKIFEDDTEDFKNEEIIEENSKNKNALINKEINDEELEKIEEEIKGKKVLTKEKKNKIYKKILKNLLLAIAIVIYFIFINLGFYNIDAITYLKDLEVFSIVMIAITLLMFERAYKHDSGELALYGIEILVVAVTTLLCIYMQLKLSGKYTVIINLIAILFALYYAVKSLVIYLKMKKKALKKSNEIYKTIKK